MFKPFFRVVETFRENGYLVTVSDRYDFDDYINGETVELHMPDGKVLAVKSHTVIDKPSNPSVGCPISLSFNDPQLTDIPTGTEVWIEANRPVRKPSRHYERRQDLQCEQSSTLIDLPKPEW